ncbi:hypothetical protein CATMIT_01759, partial [Catenibacterium mitsuokai DSM 15897]
AAERARLADVGELVRAADHAGAGHDHQLAVVEVHRVGGGRELVMLVAVAPAQFQGLGLLGLGAGAAEVERGLGQRPRAVDAGAECGLVLGVVGEHVAALVQLPRRAELRQEAVARAQTAAGAAGHHDGAVGDHVLALEAGVDDQALIEQTQGVLQVPLAGAGVEALAEQALGEFARIEEALVVDRAVDVDEAAAGAVHAVFEPEPAFERVAAHGVAQACVEAAAFDVVAGDAQRHGNRRR